WDEVTSRDFTIDKLWSKPNPMRVQLESDDGDLQAKALRSLREPLQHGGTQKDQDAYVQILTAAATKDPQPLCRLAAIRSLGRFKDPRAVEALQNAFFLANAADGFPSETHTVIRQQALAALGQQGSPAARELLVRVAKEPPVAAEGSEQEKQQALDLRLAAIRALGNYKHYDTTRALVEVLAKEKDVALRDRAHEA